MTERSRLLKGDVFIFHFQNNRTDTCLYSDSIYTLYFDSIMPILEFYPKEIIRHINRTSYTKIELIELFKTARQQK